MPDNGRHSCIKHIFQYLFLQTVILITSCYGPSNDIFASTPGDAPDNGKVLKTSEDHIRARLQIAPALPDLSKTKR